MLRIGYGIDEHSSGKHTALAEEAIEHINKAGELGSFLVEFLPLCSLMNYFDCFHLI